MEAKRKKQKQIKAQRIFKIENQKESEGGRKKKEYILLKKQGNRKKERKKERIISRKDMWKERGTMITIF